MRGATGLVTAAAAFMVLLMPPAPAGAHGGGTDSCGGHHDHERGGYHVHNYSAYCDCYPEYAVCKNYLKTKEMEDSTAAEAAPATTEDNRDGVDKTPVPGAGEED